MLTRITLLAMGLLLSLPGFSQDQCASGQNPRFFQAPPAVQASRGRRYVRNGPILFGSVYRERYGNGITDNGLSLGNTLIQTSPQIISSLQPFFVPATGLAPATSFTSSATTQTSNDSSSATASAAGSLPANTVLDDLLSSEGEHNKRLKDTYDRTLAILEDWDVEPIKPLKPNTWVLTTSTTRPPPPNGNLTVRVSPRLNISNAQVQEIFRQINGIINEQSRINGVTGSPQFNLKGSVGKYRSPGSDANIQLKSQLDALQENNKDADVLIVPALSVCVGNDEGNTGIVGCASLNEPGVQIVVEWRPGATTTGTPSALNAVVWLHELCHNARVQHLSVNRSNRLMNSSISSLSRGMTSIELNALKSLRPEQSASASAQECCDSSTEASTSGLSMATYPLEELLSQVFVDGISWSDLRARYSGATGNALAAEESSNILKVINAINRDDNVRVSGAQILVGGGEIIFENLISVLAATGQPEAIAYLENFIQTNLREPAPQAQTFVSEAMKALGLLAGSMNSDAATKQRSGELIDFLDSLYEKQLYASGPVAPAASRKMVTSDLEGGAMSPAEINNAMRMEYRSLAYSTRISMCLALKLAGSDRYREYLKTPAAAAPATAAAVAAATGGDSSLDPADVLRELDRM